MEQFFQEIGFKIYRKHFKLKAYCSFERCCLAILIDKQCPIGKQNVQQKRRDSRPVDAVARQFLTRE